MTGEAEPSERSGRPDTAVGALLKQGEEELYEFAPCGYLSTLMDGTIVRINATLLEWLGLERDAVVDRMRFSDLLTVGGRLYHETHFAPLLYMRGQVSGIALEMRVAGGARLPVLVSSAVKHDSAGEPLLIHTNVFDATERRAYEEELLHRRREAERAHAEADRARERADTDRARLKDALTVLRKALLPDSLPAVPGMEAASYYHPASPDQLGGDFYDLLRLDDTRWVFFLGDVRGKGPEAATLTSRARYALRAAALHTSEPAEALGTLNTVLLEGQAHDEEARHCTVVLGTLEPGSDGGTARVRLASGGHPPALVLRADGRADLLDTPGGMLVGVLPGAEFATAETVLAPGDTLLLYTDGLTEARTGPRRDTLYGEDGLLAFAAEHAPSSPSEVINALSDLLWSFGEGLDDDTALLALGVPAVPGTAAGRAATA
ncbi:SpoIIE family protein phosphatase [Streptomonospora nanhaiensis]|uniref:SpoIIE family protein phosphatase n=1 Tax=Streptomonospora nanhaiensis TaxID=1323731 RepID=A0ABY6YT27_9ACTN|nr:SpoIIE family protein phosphatase [Streptomonospora nanhaiensis]WAE75527.1 SpoIIE family protein phosphatase [Streptomonospora nanhaiensis]